jgi:hypothetical protein
LRTVSYSTFKSRFESAVGVDTLLSQEETALKNSLNDRIRGAWTRAKWPDVQTVVEKSVAPVTSPIVADKAVRIDDTNAGDPGELMDVFQVWTKNPLTDRNAILLDYQLINGYLVLPADSSASSVFIVGNQVPASDYGTGTTDLPAFLERYLLLACVADYYKADGQLDKALAQEQMAEETLALELDRVERLNSMNKITVNTYPSYSFGVSILSTT